MLIPLIIFLIIISPMLFRKQAAFITIQVIMGLIILFFRSNMDESFIIKIGFLWVISSLISIRISVGEERAIREIRRNVKREDRGYYTDLFIDK